MESLKDLGVETVEVDLVGVRWNCTICRVTCSFED